MTHTKKKQIFKQLLDFGTVNIVFDARLEEIKIPQMFSCYNDLRLNFSYQFHIADFNFNDVGVWATLSFHEDDFFCFVPWVAVYAIKNLKDDKYFCWPSSFPKDISQDLIDELGTKQQIDSLGKVIKIDFASFDKKC